MVSSLELNIGHAAGWYMIIGTLFALIMLLLGYI